MKTKIKEQMPIVLITLLFVLTLVPLFYISRYNYMSADDYASGIATHHSWETTKSVMQVVKTAGEMAKERYYSWQGCYASAFFAALYPAIFDERLAILVPFMILIPFYIGEFVLICKILKKVYGNIHVEACGIAVTLLWVWTQTIESPVEGFYWYNGAVHYMTMHTCMIFLLLGLMNAYSAVGKGKEIGWCIFDCICSVIIGGGNYVTVLFTLIGLLLIILLLVIKKKSWKDIVLPFLVLSACFAVSVMAPGNMVRRKDATGMSPFRAILLSFPEAMRHAKNWVTPLVVIAILFALPYMWKIMQTKRYQYRMPLLFATFTFCIWTSMYTPLLYGVGNTDAGRTLNIIQNVFYIMLFADCFYFLGWIKNKMEQSIGEVWKDLKQVCEICTKYTKQLQIMMFVLLVAIFLFTGDKNTFSSMSATRSLVKGEARIYYMELEERQKLYEDNTVSVVKCSELSVRPKVLYFNDIKQKGDPDEWINRNIARYFNKEEVYIVKELNDEQ